MGVTYHVNPFSCIEELAAACPGVLGPVRCGPLLPPHHTPVSLVRSDSVVIFRYISLRQPGRAAWTWLPQCPAPGGGGNEHLTVRDVAILLDTRWGHNTLPQASTTAVRLANSTAADLPKLRVS
ncbi:hypothetical protein Vretimale_15714 [Volvox reticuliferus]|uniref:Uncharacterized protein n=1 Tax=Volvox reticuliferus TaxID=1737510 RepID=A0A8J4GRB1_9CHLO|nr:hypothetical protein Vretimale_15714 [Volvox reticuliferus]